MGPPGAHISGLNVPLTLPKDTPFDTAKDVDKDSQSAENETFGKFLHDKNDTLYETNTPGNELSTWETKSEPLDGHHPEQGNVTTTGQDLLMDQQQGNNVTYSNTSEANSTETISHKSMNITLNGSDTQNDTIGETQQPGQQTGLEDTTVSNLSTSSNVSEWNLTQWESYKTAKIEVCSRDM